jgi:hypothetical protein
MAAGLGIQLDDFGGQQVYPAYSGSELALIHEKDEPHALRVDRRIEHAGQTLRDPLHQEPVEVDARQLGAEYAGRRYDALHPLSPDTGPKWFRINETLMSTGRHFSDPSAVICT